MLDTGANIQYVATNGSSPNLVLVGRHRNVGPFIFPSILFVRLAGCFARLRIYHSEGEEGKTRSILQLGTELCCLGCVPVAAAGRQGLE